MRTRWVLAAVPVALAVGCSSNAKAGAAHPSLSAPTPSASPSPTDSPAPVVTVTTPPPVDYGLAPGYPKVVPLAQVPDNFRANLPQEATEALLLAPNVYTGFASGETITDAIQSGGLVGLCAATNGYIAAHPDQQHGASCF